MITERGGEIVWLNKHLRSHDSSPPTSSIFRSTLQRLHSLGESNMVPSRSVFVAVDLNSMSHAHFPGSNISQSRGLTTEEILDACFASGLDTNVSYF